LTETAGWGTNGLATLADGTEVFTKRLPLTDVEFAHPPRLRAGPSPYLPGDWSLHFADVPEEWLATVAIWRPGP